MARNKPIDIDKATIPKVLRGYDPGVVHDRLDISAREIEALHSEQMQARAEIDRLKTELNGYRSMESALKDALLVAQRAADEMRANASREAENILESARQQASEQQHHQVAEVKTLLAEIDALKHEKERFQRQFRVLLEDHLRELDQHYGSPKAVVMTDSNGAPAQETVQETAAAEA